MNTRPGMSPAAQRGGIELIPLQVTKTEAAKLLRYSVRTVERLIAQGKLPTRGRGKLLRIDYQGLLDYQSSPDDR
jgi:excisionase family DNA binding protein